jgi:hypothetical protein
MNGAVWVDVEIDVVNLENGEKKVVEMGGS